jgi:hypothetical protein
VRGRLTGRSLAQNGGRDASSDSLCSQLANGLVSRLKGDGACGPGNNGEWPAKRKFKGMSGKQREECSRLLCEWWE